MEATTMHEAIAAAEEELRKVTAIDESLCAYIRPFEIARNKTLERISALRRFIDDGKHLMRVDSITSFLERPTS